MKEKKALPQSNTNTMFFVVVLLVAMAGVQVFQTQQLLKAVSNGNIKTTTQQQNNGGTIGLPSQVGGCG